MNDTFVVRAPVRIDFTGGYTDVAPFIDDVTGKSVNAAISVFTSVQVKARSDEQIHLHSLDLGVEEEIASPRQLSPHEPLGLIKRALLSDPPSCGMNLVASSEAPTGSGLGTSAAISVAMQLVTAQLSGRSPTRSEVAERAARCQRTHGLSGGRQDEYASTFGGVSALAFRGSSVERREIKLSRSALTDLASSLLLLHGGGAHQSGHLVDEVMRSLVENPQRLRPHFLALNDLADEISCRLESGSFGELSRLIEQVGRHQQGLGSRVLPDETQAVFAQLGRAGASCKLTGGGGSGACVLASFAPHRRADIIDLATHLGLTVIPFGFVTEGAQILSEGECTWP